jgi:hypothetical protein
MPNLFRLTVGEGDNIDLSEVADHRVIDTRMHNVSMYWKPPRHLRWLDAPKHDEWNQVVVVAYGILYSRVSRWHFRRCDACDGLYLASRNTARYCSATCRQRVQRG